MKGHGHFACLCVCVQDLRGQVTGIRVRGEDNWLQGDEIETHTVGDTKAYMQIQEYPGVGIKTCMHVYAVA